MNGHAAGYYILLEQQQSGAWPMTAAGCFGEPILRESANFVIHAPVECRTRKCNLNFKSKYFNILPRQERLWRSKAFNGTEEVVDQVVEDR